MKQNSIPYSLYVSTQRYNYITEMRMSKTALFPIS